MTIAGYVKEQARKDNFVPKNLSNDEFVNVVYENKAETTEERDQRDLNLIVHGVKEDDAGSNTDRLVMELFDTIGMEHLSTTPAHRLGNKSPDRIRPIKITLESYERKNELLSKLWRLKNGAEKFRKISITEDFTQEERSEIKLWVEEAKERTKEEDKYIWKVRGSPRNKLRLVKLRKQ